jgi:hypothetical protein
VISAAGEVRPSSIEELVDPALAARLDRLDLASRSIFAGKMPGERRSKRKGRSVEFDDFRQYLPGDDLRHIDWNVLARLDRLFIKVFRQDEDLSLHLIVDRSASMDAGSPSKRLFAVRLAMALGYIGLVKQNRVSCSLINPEPSALEPLTQISGLRGRRSTHRLGRFLLDSFGDARPSEGSPKVSQSPASESIRRAVQTSRSPGIIVVISDFMFPEGPGTALNMVAAGAGAGSGVGSRDLWAIQVVSPAEIDPEAEQESGLFGDVRLIDSESGSAAEVTISKALLRHYRQRFNTFSTDLQRACAARGIAMAQTRSDSKLDELITSTLRRGGLFR